MALPVSQIVLGVLILGILGAVLLVVTPSRTFSSAFGKKGAEASLAEARAEVMQLREQLEKCRKECKDGKVKAFGQAAGVPSKNEKSEEGSSNDAPSKKNKEEVPKNKKKVDEEKNSEKEESTTTAPAKKTKKKVEEEEGGGSSKKGEDGETTKKKPQQKKKKKDESETEESTKKPGKKRKKPDAKEEEESENTSGEEKGGKKKKLVDQTSSDKSNAAKAVQNLVPINTRIAKPPPPVILDNASWAPVDYFHYPGETFMDAGRETASLPTDKMTVHRYEVLYENYFAPLRNTKYKLCEIGLGCGQFNGVGRGYELFTKYTPLVEMHGIEFNKPCQQTLRQIGKMSKQEKKTKQLAMFNEEDAEYMIKNWVWGDQSSGAVMDELIEKFGPFDMIIDDGSHLPEHMALTFAKLFVEGLAPGGVYFVEDIMFPANGAYRGAFMDMVATLGTYIHWHFKEDRLKDPKIISEPYLRIHQWLQRIDCEHAICAFVKRKQMLTTGNRARIPPRTDPKYWWPFPGWQQDSQTGSS